jgi:hypothetical protein
MPSSDDSSSTSSSGEANPAGAILGVAKMQAAVDQGARVIQALNQQISALNSALTNAITGLKRTGQTTQGAGGGASSTHGPANTPSAAGMAQVRPGSGPSYGGGATMPNASIPITASQRRGAGTSVSNSGAPGWSQRGEEVPGGAPNAGGGSGGGSGGSSGSGDGSPTGGGSSVPEPTSQGRMAGVGAAVRDSQTIGSGMPTTVAGAVKFADSQLQAGAANWRDRYKGMDLYYQQEAAQSGKSMSQVRQNSSAFQKYNTFTSVQDQANVQGDALQMSGGVGLDSARARNEMGNVAGANLMAPGMTGTQVKGAMNGLWNPQMNLRMTAMGFGGTLDSTGNTKGIGAMGQGMWDRVTGGAGMTKKGVAAAFGRTGSMRTTALANGMTEDQINLMQRNMQMQAETGKSAEEIDSLTSKAAEDNKEGKAALKTLKKAGATGLDSLTSTEKKVESHASKRVAEESDSLAKSMKKTTKGFDEINKEMKKLTDFLGVSDEIGSLAGNKDLKGFLAANTAGNIDGQGGGPGLGGLGGGFPSALNTTGSTSGGYGGSGGPPGSPGNEGLGAGMKTYHGKSVKQALSYMKSQSSNPTQSWKGQCLRSVNLAWGGNLGRGYDAREAYGYTKKHHKGGTPPAGAPLWWPNNGPHGHVGLSAGGGMMWSNDVKRDGQIDKVSINFLKQQWGYGDPIWTEDLGGQMLPLDLKNTGGTGGDDEEGDDSKEEEDSEDTSSGGNAINALGDRYGSANEKDVLSAAMGSAAGASGPGSSDEDKKDDSTEDEAADEDKKTDSDDNPGGTGVQRWKPIAQKVAKELGRPKSDANYILKTIKKESGGDPNIVNKSDSNWQAGTPSVGLMQVIGPTFKAYAGKYKKTGPFKYGTSTNGHANIYAGSNYAIKRYGSSGLERAARPGGYAKGAFNIPEDEDTTVHKGEMIIPRRSAETIRNALLRETQPVSSPAARAADRAAGVANRNGGGGGGTVKFEPGAIQINVNGSDGTNGKQLWREIRTAIENDDRIKQIGAGA